MLPPNTNDLGAGRGEGGGSSDLLATLGRSGIVCPPGAVSPEVRTFGPWHWGTAHLDPSELYRFDVEAIAQRLVTGPAFALCHAGHGVNSYGLSLVASAGPAAAFAQHHFGGVYSDPVLDRDRINSTYARLHVLLEGTVALAGPPRWLMVYSSLRGVRGIVDLDGVRAGHARAREPDRVESESALFAAMAGKFPGTRFTSSASFSW